MKRIFSIAAVVMLLVVLVMGSCEKENTTSIENNENEINLIESKVLNQNFDDIKVSNGRLVFNNLESFRSTYRELDSMNNLYSLECQKIFHNLTVEEIIELSETKEIDYNLVYSNFENSLNFRSLRAEIQDKVDKFNEIYDQKELSNPDNHYICDKTLRTLLNTNGEVIIGNSIFIFMTEEITVEIFNLDFSILEKLNINSLENLEKDGLITVYGDYKEDETCVECKATKCRENISTGWDVYTWWEDNIKRKIEGKIYVVNNAVLFTHYIKSTVKTHYWNGRKWKNWNTDLYADVKGWVYTKNKCDDDGWYRAKSDDARDDNRLTVKARMYGKFFSVKPGEISARFEAGEDGILTTTLSW